jgi:hypothetical protein
MDMKTVFFVLLLLPGIALAQTIALLDRNFKKPIAVTETLTREQLSGKWFPIYVTDLDTVIKVAEALAHAISNGTLPPSNTQLIQAGHSHFAVAAQRTGGYTTCNIALATQSGNMGATLLLVRKEDSNRKAAQLLLLFLDYIKNNRHMAVQKSNGIVSAAPLLSPRSAWLP